MMNILICDDEKDIVSALEIYLTSDQYRLYKAYNGVEAVRICSEQEIHLILMDIMMPVMDGIMAMQRIRQSWNMPIILLTAKGEDIDKIMGLNQGADDYITKPFSMEELVLRIEAIIRRVRGKKSKEQQLYNFGTMTFDTQKQILTIAETQTKLTTKESELLSLLCAHANDILERNHALKQIWEEDTYFNARSMDVYITKLRKLLKPEPNIEIINIHGKGYKLIVPTDEGENGDN